MNNPEGKVSSCVPGPGQVPRGTKAVQETGRDPERPGEATSSRSYLETKGEVGRRGDQVLPDLFPSRPAEIFQPSADPQRHSLQTESLYGSLGFCNLASFSNPSTRSLLSAGYDADSFKKTGEEKTEKRDLNEDRNESLIINQGSQTSTPEKQMTKDEKLSEGVWGTLQSQGVRRLLQSLHDNNSWRLLQKQNMCISSAQSVRDTDRLQHQQSLLSSGLLYNKFNSSWSPVCSIDTKGDVGESGDQVLPRTSFQWPLPVSRSAPRSAAHLRRSLETESEHGNPTFPKRRSFFDWSTCSAFTARYSTDSDRYTYKVFHSSSVCTDPCPEASPRLSASVLGYKKLKGKSRGLIFRRANEQNKASCSVASSADSPDYSLDPPPPGTHTETGRVENPTSAANASPAVSQDTTREPGPDPTVAGPPCPQGSPAVLHASPVFSAVSGYQDAFELLSVQSESDALVETEASVPAVKSSVTNTLPARSHLQSSSDSGWSQRDPGCLPRSHSVASLSQIPSAKNKTFTRANSSPDMLLKTSFEEFTPDIDENDETYRFQCSCPGLYQCSVTSLVFHMDGEGDVDYRIVPWNRRLLARHHKQPAGPLFDIKCLQQSVRQLHLPHCEIRSTGGCDFLSVAHENDEGIEFIAPQKITETHVIINIAGFSAFGNVKDEDSPPVPVRALVLLFYRPSVDPDVEFLLNVLLLPKNVVLQDLLRTRKKLFGDERYIETPSHCELHPKQEYTLSTCPEDDSVLVQPTEAEFDRDNYDNYFPSFQVNWETMMKQIKLLLRETESSLSVWERRVRLSSTGVRRSCGPSALNLPSSERLFEVRSSFVDGISGPVLKSLLDKLLEKKVMTDSERESVDGVQINTDKARFVIDTVRKKGEAASSEMIELLCEMDPFLCEHLGLM